MMASCQYQHKNVPRSSAKPARRISMFSGSTFEKQDSGAFSVDVSTKWQDIFIRTDRELVDLAQLGETYSSRNDQNIEPLPLFVEGEDGTEAAPGSTSSDRGIEYREYLTRALSSKNHPLCLMIEDLALGVNESYSDVGSHCLLLEEAITLVNVSILACII